MVFDPWNTPALFAAALALCVAVYITFRWRRAPKVWRAMSAIGIIGLMTGFLGGLSVSHFVRPSFAPAASPAAHSSSDMPVAREPIGEPSSKPEAKLLPIVGLVRSCICSASRLAPDMSKFLGGSLDNEVHARYFVEGLQSCEVVFQAFGLSEEDLENLNKEQLQALGKGEWLIADCDHYLQEYHL